jgi:hypothetical protein
VDEFPIETSVDEFVDAILKATGDRVVCSACGNTEWAIYDATPMTLNADNLRPGVPEDDTIIGLHVVALRLWALRTHPLSWRPAFFPA